MWANEGDPNSLGMQLSTHFRVDQAPFFIVREGAREDVYVSVLQLARERFAEKVSAQQQAAAINVDDIGGI